MTYQQAGRIAVLKRILGWVIFIPALISTLISLLKFMIWMDYLSTQNLYGIEPNWM
ncbi:YniB family protein [Escherichia coli]